MESLPLTIEYGAIGPDPEQSIGHSDVMEVALFFITEEQIWNPNPTDLQ